MFNLPVVINSYFVYTIRSCILCEGGVNVISSKIFGLENVLGKTLQVYSLRNEVIQNNIANVDTPNFKKSTVRFEDRLKDEIRKKGRAKLEIDQINPTVNVIDQNYTMRMDGNNVDIDAENVQLYMNAVRTDAIANSVITNFKILNMGIMGR